MAAFKIAETPIAGGGRLVGTTNAAHAFATLHALEKDLKHRAGSLADGDNKDALVCGEIDGGRAAAIGHEAVKPVALKAQTAIEGGSDIACLERAGEDVSGRGVHCLKGRIAYRGHGSSSLRSSATPKCVSKQVDKKAEFIPLLILRRKGVTGRVGPYGILATS
jgi:hypothetical protein